MEQKTTSYGSKLMEELIGYIPKRTKELRQRCVDATPEVCVERARLITEAYEEYGSLPVTMKRAMTFEKILNEMSLYIQSGELIVGNLSSKLRAAPIYPEYDVEFILKEIEGFPTRPGDPLCRAGGGKERAYRNLWFLERRHSERKGSFHAASRYQGGG